MRDGHSEFLRYHHGSNDITSTDQTNIEILTNHLERLEAKEDNLLTEIKKLNTL